VEGSLAVVPYTASDIETFVVSEMAPGGAFEGAGEKRPMKVSRIQFVVACRNSVGEGMRALGSSAMTQREAFTETLPSLF